MKPNAILLLALSLPSPVLAASAYTLCHTNETVVFSCATGTHFLSLCASPNLSKEAGYLQYRYGSKDKLELVYPTTPQPPTGLFVPFEQTYSGGFGSFVQFKNNNYTYTVFDAVGKWGESCFTPHERAETCLLQVEGVAVQNNGKKVANIQCRKDADFVEHAIDKMVTAKRLRTTRTWSRCTSCTIISVAFTRAFAGLRRWRDRAALVNQRYC